LPVTTSTQTTVDTQPTESQQKAVQSLNGVKGDIDGMQAPPLNIQVETTDSSGKTTTTNNSTVVLPPIKDSDVAPPKDLDLPPTDDLGNLNLDSKNK
jgi:hypothetical protein